MFKINYISRVSIVALTVFVVANTSPLQAGKEKEDLPTTVTTIRHLVDEEILLILNYLSLHDLTNLTQVSKYWHRLAEDESLSKSRFMKVAVEDKTVKKIIKKLYDSDLINEFRDLGYSKAKERHLKLCDERTTGYLKRYIFGTKMIDQLANEGIYWGKTRQIKGYLEGVYGYPQNESLARELLEKLANEGKFWARKELARYYLEGSHGYPQKESLARELLEQLVNEGKSLARNQKAYAHFDGNYGYPKDRDKIRELLDQWADKGDNWARNEKVMGHTDGRWGYPIDENECQKHIKIWIQRNCELVAAGDPIAILNNIIGVAFGLYGYPENQAFFAHYLYFLKSVKHLQITVENDNNQHNANQLSWYQKMLLLIYFQGPLIS